MATNNLSSGITKAVIAAGVIFMVLMSSSLLVSAASNKSNSGKNASLSIYSDSACTKKITSISWGSIAIGGSVNKTVYVKNTGTTALTLNLVQANWYPASISNSIICTWNRENTALTPNQAVSATIILKTVNSFNSTTNFNVDIMITGKN